MIVTSINLYVQRTKLINKNKETKHRVAIKSFTYIRNSFRLPLNNLLVTALFTHMHFYSALIFIYHGVSLIQQPYNWHYCKLTARSFCPTCNSTGFWSSWHINGIVCSLWTVDVCLLLTLLPFIVKFKMGIARLLGMISCLLDIHLHENFIDIYYVSWCVLGLEGFLFITRMAGSCRHLKCVKSSPPATITTIIIMIIIIAVVITVTTIVSIIIYAVMVFGGFYLWLTHNVLKFN